MTRAASSPLFSIVTAVYDPPEYAFRDAVASVLAQQFRDFEWTLVDDCSPSQPTRDLLQQLGRGDNRIHVIERETNGGIVAASNDAIARSSGTFVVLLDHDDMLEPGALAAAAKVAAEFDDVDYIYSDHLKVRDDGTVQNVLHKADWSPELLRHSMYTLHMSVIRRSVLTEVGGFRRGFDGSQDHDLVLRVTERARRIVHIPEGLYGWRMVPGSVAGDATAKPYAWDSGQRAVKEHLDRVGLRADMEKSVRTYHHVVRRDPDLRTPVSVIISTDGAAGTVWGADRVHATAALRSLAFDTSHSDVEFVVVHGPPTPAAALDELRLAAGANVRLVAGGETVVGRRNLGASAARGDVLVFVDDDVEVRTSEFLGQLIAPLSESSVGATGAKLFQESTRIQSAGYFVQNGAVERAYRGWNSGSYGVHAELIENREVSALPGACLAIRRSTFEKVGGFDESYPSELADVDFAFRLRSEGLRLVWLFLPELYHFEATDGDRSVDPGDAERLQARWPLFAAEKDPYRSLMLPWKAP